MPHNVDRRRAAASRDLVASVLPKADQPHSTSDAEVIVDARMAA